MKNKLRMLSGTLQKALLSGGHVIEPNDAVTCGKQSIDHIAADKPSRTRNEIPAIEPPIERRKQIFKC